MPKVNLITQAEYARHRGVSEAAVSKALAAGRVTLTDGKIDPVAADAQWARNSRVRANAKPPAAQVANSDVGDPEAPGADNYWTARSRREQAEAELAEIDLAERTGQVIQVKAVEAVWAQALGATREHLLQVRARLAPLLAAESDVFKIEQLLDAEHAQALQHLAKATVAHQEMVS